MRPEICLICNDKRKYESHVSQARNIVHRLSILAEENTASSFNEDENHLLHELKHFISHPHFMCGSCYMVNTSELRNEEDKIDILLVNLAKNMDVKSRKYHDVLRLLSGAYSGKYKVFEHYCQKNSSRK